MSTNENVAGAALYFSRAHHDTDIHANMHTVTEHRRTHESGERRNKVKKQIEVKKKSMGGGWGQSAEREKEGGGEV